MRTKVIAVVFLGILVSVAQARPIFEAVSEKSARNVQDALYFANGITLDAANSNCTSSKGLLHKTATFDYHPRRVLTAKEDRAFANVGLIGRATDGNYVIGGTGNITGCPCVVTTAAHIFWANKQPKFPGSTHYLRLVRQSDGKVFRQDIISIEKVGTTDPTNDSQADKDWAVVTIKPSEDSNIVPFKIPADGVELSELRKSTNLVSVGYHADLAQDGDLGRRITDCDFNVEWNPYWSNAGISKDNLNLNSCSLFGMSSFFLLGLSTHAFSVQFA